MSLMYTHSLVTHLRTRSTVDNIATPKRVEVEFRIYETNRILVNCFNSCKGIKTHQINTFQTMTSNTVTDRRTDVHTDIRTDRHTNGLIPIHPPQQIQEKKETPEQQQANFIFEGKYLSKH